MKKHLKRRITWNTLPERINKVRTKILTAGNTIGSVTFEKRTDESIRRMSYRLHAVNPSFAQVPSSNHQTKEKNLKNLQLTVLDVNKVIRDEEGRIIGRGAYRTIPLENVHQISVRGIIYSVDEIKRRNIFKSNEVGPEFSCLPY